LAADVAGVETAGPWDGLYHRKKCGDRVLL